MIICCGVILYLEINRMETIAHMSVGINRLVLLHDSYIIHEADHKADHK